MTQPKQLQGMGFDSRSKEERIALASKAGKIGGASKSPKKTLAQRIRASKCYSDVEMKSSHMLKAIAMLEDPSLFESDVLTYALKIKDEADKSDSPHFRAKILDSLNNTFKTLFGERIKMMHLNLTPTEDVANEIVNNLFGDMKIDKKGEDDGSGRD